MEIFQTVGIDISKLTLDARVHTSKAYKSFKNEDSGFKSLLKWAAQNNKFSIKNTLFVFEHTGLYSYLIAVFLGENTLRVETATISLLAAVRAWMDGGKLRA